MTEVVAVVKCMRQGFFLFTSAMCRYLNRIFTGVYPLTCQDIDADLLFTNSV